MALFVNDSAFDSLYAVSATRYAAGTGLDVPGLIALAKGTTMQESRFNPAAYRFEPKLNDASRGLMQLLLSTARAIGYSGDVGDDTAHTGGLYDPATNIDLGVKLLAENLRRASGNLTIAVSAYNGGFSEIRPNDAKRDGSGNLINQPYVDAVLNYYNGYLGQQSASPAAASAFGGIDLTAVPWWAWVGGAILVGTAAALSGGKR